MRLKNNYKKLSLAGKFSLLSIAIIILIIITFTFIIRLFSEEMALEIASDGYIGKFDAVSQNCMNLFSDAERISKILCTDNDIQNWFSGSDVESKQKYLQAKMQVEKRLDYFDALYSNNQFSSISIYTVDGDMINTNNIRSRGQTYTTFFNDFVSNTTEAKWVDLYELQNNAYEAAGIAYVMPYKEYSTGRIKGYIMVEYLSDILIENFSRLRYGETGEYVIVDYDGYTKIMTGVDESRNIKGEQFFKYAVNKEVGKTVVLNDKKYLVTSSNISTLQWVMIGLTPIKSLTEKGETIIKLIYIIGFCAILLNSGINVIIAHNITKPLSELADNMERLGTGELQVTVPVRSEDEIGMLAKQFNKMTEQIQNLIAQVYTEQRAKRKFEFSVLQAQINPHFLYNTLNSVCSLVSMRKSEDANTMIRAIGQFYRTALSNGKTIIPIEDEISNIKNYIQIQSMRYGDKIRYNIDIEENIMKEYIVKLTLQPLIENSIYHGVKELSTIGEIEILGRIEGDNILISVIDNGVGIPEDILTELLKRDDAYNENSFGLYNIHQRIQIYFGKEYGLWIKSEVGKGTNATVKIPLNYKGEIEI
ncbi:MAG: sensor histidine kinase [Herbinix sp.]|nr:sensor histidine kinase [Herbinix sp.]